MLDGKIGDEEAADVAETLIELALDKKEDEVKLTLDIFKKVIRRNRMIVWSMIHDSLITIRRR